MYSRPEGTYGVFQPERVHSCVSQDSDLEAMIRHMEDVLNGDSVGEYLYDLISLSFHTGKCIKQRLIHQISVFFVFFV